MNFVKLFWIISLLTFSSLPHVFGQKFLIHAAKNVKDGILFTIDSDTLISEGFFPISYSKARYELPEKDTLKKRNWVVRKLLKEHFVQLKGKNYLLAVDPLFEMNLGKEILQKTYPYVYQNTRGFQAFGEVKGILSFYTAFYENQARFVDYQEEYFRSRGEYYPNSDGSLYSQQNAVVPNGGRTKPFKANAFDYASSTSYIRLTPIKQIAVQFGNQPRFFGWGHRSLLMSDNSFNFTHLDIDLEIVKGLNYSIIRGQQLNLFRKVYTNLIEKPYEKKGVGVHYLSYRVNPSFVIGLFESTIYLRDEAKSAQRVNKYFYNPIIGVNTVVSRGQERNGMKNLIGLNSAWKFHPQHLVYLQFASDDLKNFEYGFQVGYRLGNPFKIKNLHIQVEYNQASSRLYAAENKRMNYTHFNLPLAHTLGNDFKELIGRISYKWKGIYIDIEGVLFLTQQPLAGKTTLFESKSHSPVLQPTKTLNTNIELGYELNPATQLRAFIGANYRISKTDGAPRIDYGTAFFGLRSSLRNQYFDF
ncbi:MAG: hypothetical protein WC994_05180 [Brumimicrobium sp.]